MFINICEHNCSNKFINTYLTFNEGRVDFAKESWYSLAIPAARSMSFADPDILTVPLCMSLDGIPSADTKGDITAYLPVGIL